MGYRAPLINTLLCYLVVRSLQAWQATPSPVTFVDVAQSSGITALNVFGPREGKKYLFETTGCGVAFFDYNKDGWQDIFLVNGSSLEGFAKGPVPTNHLYHNNRDGTFTDVTERAGLVRSGWGQGVCVGDYDNDGFDDLFVTYYGQNALYHNDGDGTFTDVTVRAGVFQDRTRWNTGCAFLDYDRDGYLDLFVANYVEFDLVHTPPAGSPEGCHWKGLPVVCGPRGLKPAFNILYRNNVNGTFTDVSDPAGILAPGPHYGFSVLTLDFNNDDWPDIYVACDSIASLLYQNNQDGTFTEVGVLAGAAYSEDGREQGGMGAAAGDYDRDGFLDIFKTNFSDDTVNLYHNNGDGTFTDVTFASGLGHNIQYVGWGTAFIDFDNDGWLDIFQVNGHIYYEVDSAPLDTTYEERRIVYKNLRNGRFKDISFDLGPGITMEKSSRGAAFGDFDNDGDVDVLIGNMNEPASLLRNDGGNQNNWLNVELVGTKSNRSAIGARLTVTTASDKSIDEVRSGGSYSSQSDLPVHFGLGERNKTELLEIRWPSGLVQTFHNLPANQFIRITEGSDRAERLTY